ncbi:MAG: PEP-CTERM sorting domain-containing protein [Candidatus Rokuibacteriota bacterium]
MNPAKVRSLRRLGYTLIVMGIALSVPSLAAAITYDTGPLVFQTTGQSMWGSGQAAQLEASFFLGTTWSESASIGGIAGGVVETTTIPVPHVVLPSGWECHGFLCTGGHFHNPGGIVIVNIPGPDIDTRTGAEVDVSTTGRVGFNFGARMDSGSVDATVQFNAQAILPDPQSIAAGTFFNLNPSSLLAAGQLNTNFPEVSAKLEAVLGAQASFLGQACFIALGCGTGSTTVGFPDQTLELISFNDTDSPGQIKILGALDLALFQFGEPISIPNPVNPLGEIGNVTIHVPDINAVGGVAGNTLTASGMDDFLDLRVDIDGLILGAFGLPGLGIQLDVGIFGISGDLLDVELGPTMKIVQDFELTPTLMVDLQFDRPVLVDGLAAPATSLTSSWNALPNIALLDTETLVSPRFFLSTLFGNETFLGVDGVFTLEALKASLALTAFGLSADLGQLGPLFALEQRGNLFNSPALFNQQFALDGFNAIVGDSFLLTTMSSVPQPGSLILLGAGVVAFRFMVRRRRPAGPVPRTSR